MAINTANLETVLNSKIASATTATLDKDLLLISKSVEALIPSITVQNVISEGTTQVGSITTEGTTQVSNVTTEGTTQVSNVTTEGATQVAAVQAAGSSFATSTDVATAVTDMATNADVANAVAGIVDSAPAALDTLSELASALQNDANHAAVMTTAIGNKINTANPTFTGTLDGAGNSYTNLHPAVETTGSATGTHAIDFNTPYHNVNISGATTFSFQNSDIGKICIIQLAALAGQTPSFPSTVKWAGAEEPTWGDYGMWVISLTGVNASWMVGSAVGITV